MGTEDIDTTPSIVCPRCGLRSYNPNDVAQRYCGNCHMFHADMSVETSERDPEVSELARITRARDIACASIVVLNDELAAERSMRAKGQAALTHALLLVDYLIADLRNGGVVPSHACQAAKRSLDMTMAELVAKPGAKPGPKPEAIS